MHEKPNRRFLKLPRGHVLAGVPMITHESGGLSHTSARYFASEATKNDPLDIKLQLFANLIATYRALNIIFSNEEILAIRRHYKF